MNISVSYEELSVIASFCNKRKIVIKYDSDNSFSLHTKEKILFFGLDIDWYFTLLTIENNCLHFKVKTSGWASTKGLKDIIGNQYGVKLDGESLVVDILKIRPYKYRIANIVKLLILPQTLDITLKIDNK